MLAADDDEPAHDDSENDEHELPPCKRPRITRGDLLSVDDKVSLRLEIGICSAVRDGDNVLEVSCPQHCGPAAQHITASVPLRQPVSAMELLWLSARHTLFILLSWV